MRMSDLIAQFILDTLRQSGGEVELQRNELAERMGCVPSQINYVIATRFSPEHGYVVQSRRGGGGYIRIARINADRPSMIMHTVNAIGDTLDLRSAHAMLQNLVSAGCIPADSANIILTAVGSRALAPVSAQGQDPLRARIVKLCLVEAARQQGEKNETGDHA